MTPRATLAWCAMALSICFAVPAAAQDVTAEVRTWTGQSWRLDQPSLEVYYTIVPGKEKEGGAPTAPVGGAPGAPMGGGGSSGVTLSGTAGALGSFLDQGPEPLRGHRQARTVTLRRGGVETRIPVGSVASLAFTRQPVKNSTLPPHVAKTHFRYAATAILTDGSRIEGEYVNLGTTLLRGTTPQGRVDIPWEEIETIRFQR